MTAIMTTPNRPAKVNACPLLDIYTPAERIRPGEVAPTLYPLPNTRSDARRESRPKETWERYWQLPKRPLLVRGFIGQHRIEGTHYLDALLTECQLRSLDTIWGNNGDAVRVIPLPLDLLCLVRVNEFPQKQAKWPFLPVWAATPFIPERLGQIEALCIGHADTVRHLLQFMPQLMSYAVRWEVVEVPLPDAEAREIISEQRPMPDVAPRWTVPYDYDWTQRHTPDTARE